MMTSEPPPLPANTQDPEYSVHPSHRHHHREAHHAGNGARRFLRGAFFALAALWGFVAGAVAIALGAAMGGNRVEWSPSAIVALIAGAVAAAAGGWLSSKAYADLRHRS
jgi:hypothetical protein